VRGADYLTTFMLNVMKICEPKPPETLWATPNLLRDSTFFKLCTPLLGFMFHYFFYCYCTHSLCFSISFIIFYWHYTDFLCCFFPVRPTLCSQLRYSALPFIPCYRVTLHSRYNKVISNSLALQ